jgi:hypothetical protein
MAPDLYSGGAWFESWPDWGFDGFPLLTKIGMFQQHLVEVSELNETCAVV